MSLGLGLVCDWAGGLYVIGRGGWYVIGLVAAVSLAWGLVCVWAGVWYVIELGTSDILKQSSTQADATFGLVTDPPAQKLQKGC